MLIMISEPWTENHMTFRLHIQSRKHRICVPSYTFIFVRDTLSTLFHVCKLITNIHHKILIYTRNNTATMAINAARVVLKQRKSALFICDIQESFRKAIFEFDKMVQNSSRLINALKVLNVPMLATEQNPKALGKTVPELDISAAKGCFPKTQFSMCTPEVRKVLATMCDGERPEAIILIGIEGHICVENTAIDLRQNGYEVHTVADCCSSRTQEDRLLALERMRDMGCHITTTENVLYKLMRDSKHEQFRKVLTFVKTPSVYTGLVPLSKI